MKGKTKMKCLIKVLGHYLPPEQLHCTLALILQCVSSTGGIITILPKDIILCFDYCDGEYCLMSKFHIHLG